VFSNGLSHFLKNEADILNTTWFSHLDSYENIQNVHYWALQNQETLTDNPLHPQQVTARRTLPTYDAFTLVSIEDIVSYQIYFNVLHNDSVTFPRIMVLMWLRPGSHKMAPRFRGGIVLDFLKEIFRNTSAFKQTSA
jgi:hypothetical protein